MNSETDSDSDSDSGTESTVSINDDEQELIEAEIEEEIVDVEEFENTEADCEEDLFDEEEDPENDDTEDEEEEGDDNVEMDEEVEEEKELIVEQLKEKHGFETADWKRTQQAGQVRSDIQTYIRSQLEKSKPKKPVEIIYSNDEVLSFADSCGDVSTHRTVPVLTKFEMARVLSIRVQQLSGDACSFLQQNEKPQLEAQSANSTPMNLWYVIAIEELRLSRLPFIIQRPISESYSEFWHVKDLLLVHLHTLYQ